MTKKKYVFGYGSLVSAKDIERTLGHPPEELLPATLSGWIRDWSIVLDNTITTRRYELSNHQIPQYVAVLNIRKPLANENPTNPNGVLFAVSDEDIAKMDERESHYLRQNITDQIAEKIDGQIFAYVGMEEFLINQNLLQQAIVPQSYRLVVENGFASFSDQDLKQFRATTIPALVPELPTSHATSLATV